MPALPSLLPYLSDRSEQEDELERALRYWQEHKPRRPFICVIHGDEYECHDMFLERLKIITLPKFLQLNPEQVRVQFYSPLEWPSSSRALSHRVELLRRNLAALLHKDRSASIAEMHKALSQHTGPVMITSHASPLFTEDWPYAERELIGEFMKFWNAWPDLGPGRLLLICLCIHYQNAEMLGFFRKRQWRKFNTAIRSFLHNVDFSAYNKLHGVRLELSAIPRKDVEDWARSSYVREVCHVIEHAEIRALYERAELLTAEGRIPMEKLAAECKKLLDKHRIDRSLDRAIPLLYREA